MDKETLIPEENSEDDRINENGKRLEIDDSTQEHKKQHKTNLFRQPTVQELNRLQETENLYQSNFFRLQIDEGLKEMKIKKKTEKRFDGWFTKFKRCLESIPEDNTEYILSESMLIEVEHNIKLRLPVNSGLEKSCCVFKFYKFTNIEIVGAYALGCALRAKLKVDVQIRVPADTYTKNDSINYRYHKKRAAYLAYIGRFLLKADFINKCNYSWLYGCETKPVLDVKPAGKLGKYLIVRINLVCDADTFTLQRFSPTRNNLREAWVFPYRNVENHTETGSATPYYNNSVLSDLTSSINQKFLSDTLSNCDNLKQAIVLLKLWLRGRQLQVSGHIISLIVAYFVQNKRINNIMSNYQIVRNIWIAIKSSNWDTKGISLIKESESAPAIEEFHEQFPVVFVDLTGYYNICWQMNKGTYMALKRESGLAVDMLDNAKINCFFPLFLTTFDPLCLFDHILRFKDVINFISRLKEAAPTRHQLNYGVDYTNMVADLVVSLLLKGLGNRVKLILPLIDAEFSWEPSENPKALRDENYLVHLAFGFILDPDNAMDVVEKGPPANLPEAEEFRNFWGTKSELRRFQDGSVTETCVWSGETVAEQRTITKQIVDYLLNLKYEVDPKTLFHVGSQLDDVLIRKRFAADPGAHSVETCARGLLAFHDLRTYIRNLAGLPLQINALQGTSSMLSYSDPLPPIASGKYTTSWRRGNAALIKEAKRKDGLTMVPEYVRVCKAIIELSHSGKWPSDIEAFRGLKAAFYARIAEQLTEQYSLPAQAAPEYVDVLKNGLVFRLAIAHPKEITLLRRQTENGVVKHRESEETIRLQRDTVLLPRLRGALYGLHQRHSAFGPTAALFQRWLSSHGLSPPHVPTTVAELLTAAVFIHCHPASEPFSPTLALYRVLSLLAHTDWTYQVIILDFNEDMTREEIADIKKELTRAGSEGPCMKIATAYDASFPALWSREAPTAQVLARAQQLAESALLYFEKRLMDDWEDNVLGAFVPSLVGYDLLILMHTRLVPYAYERVDQPAQQRRLPDKVLDDVIPVVEFHPVCKYLEELRSAYSEFALFFNDQYGGALIAVLWKPGIDDYRDFQLSNANALIPEQVGGEIKYRVNKEAIIEDFKILGEGLVKDITILNEDLCNFVK